MSNLSRCWKPANMDKDSSLASSYRPISLLNSIGKVFEKVVLKLLLSEMFCKNLLHNNRFGSCAGLSSEGTVLKLVTKIRSSISTNDFAVVISYDIKGAFDNCK